MPYSFRSEQWLPYPVETVFALFADPENLPALMPAWQRARIERITLVPPPSAGGIKAPAAGAGTRLVLSLRPLRAIPIRVRWHAEIVQFEGNRSFCDRQIRGPFAYWQHCHRVRALDRNGPTVLTDEVEYDLPLGILGHMAHALFVQRQIEAAFAYRHQRTLEALARAASAPAQPAQPSKSPRGTRAS